MTTTPTDLVASTQDYPDKPVRMVEPFGTGGGPDLMARALAPKLSELWGQPVTVENVPGVGATAAPALVAQSRADGYTLLINTSAQAYGAALPRNLPYHPLKDFIPVAPLTSQPYVLVVGKPAGDSNSRFGMEFGSRLALRPPWSTRLRRASRSHSLSRICRNMVCCQ